MSKPHKKSKTNIHKDYFKLPFEVYFSGPLSVTLYEFKSDIAVKRFKDIKAVHMEQGRAWGVLFSCDVNTGPELFCCIRGGFDDATPEWLGFESESDMNFNYGCDYAVKVENGVIRFVDEEVDDVDDMDHCCAYSFLDYDLDSICPDYIIIDSDDTRLKIDTDGYLLNEDGKRVNNERIINTDELDEEALSEYTTRDMWEVKAAWVQSVLDKQFPREKKLRLAYDTE